MENARRKALRSYLTQRNINGKRSRVIFERAGCNLQPWWGRLPKDEEQSSFINYISQQENEDSKKPERRLAVGCYVCPARQGRFLGKLEKSEPGVFAAPVPCGAGRPRGCSRRAPALEGHPAAAAGTATCPPAAPATGLGARHAQRGLRANSGAGDGKARGCASGRGLLLHL